MTEKSDDRGALGHYLWDVRNARRMSLRQVEDACDVSNAYLSQLETGKIKQPSPHVLHELAEVYGVPYEMLMKKAGYVRENDDQKTKPTRTRKGRVATFVDEDLTEQEEEELLKYLAFLRTRKK